MREILFRGKSVNDGRWLFGDLSNYGVCKTITTVKDFRIIDSCEVIPETVGQYTGLKDKNGTKIFEGDVVSGHLDDLFPEDETRYKVIWDDYGWHIRNSTGTDTFEQGWARQYFEVIGNIHDNPELIDKIK